VAAAFRPAARRFLVIAAFRPAVLRLRVWAAFFPALRRFLVAAALRPAVAMALTTSQIVSRYLLIENVPRASISGERRGGQSHLRRRSGGKLVHTPDPVMAFKPPFSPPFLPLFRLYFTVLSTF